MRRGLLRDLPGDCGDEYRREPFLTARGDLSDHLQESDQALELAKALEEGKRVEHSSASKWESIAVSLPCPHSLLLVRKEILHVDRS